MKDRAVRAVCMLVTDLDAPTGGVQKNSRIVLSELPKRGIDVLAVARNYYGLASKETRDGVEYHRSPVWGRSMAVNGVLYLIYTFVWLLRNRGRFDIIHCQQMFGPTMAAAVASYFIRKPIVTRLTTTGELGEVRHIRKMAFAAIRLRLIRRVTRWIVLTSAMKAELETLGITPEIVDVIPNSTEIPVRSAYDPNTRREMREKLELTGEKIAVYVGRLSEEKGLDILVDAWRSVRDHYPSASLLLIGGGGTYRNVETQLREQVAAAGLGDSIRFLGHVSNANEYVLASDAFILPSRTEGMSNALVEAIAAGASIVATDIPANRELCNDGLDSLLVPVGDADALAEAISKVFSSEETAVAIGKAARRKAEAELSVDRMIDSYMATYEKALAGEFS
jgi:glycosyltransferase involved in cell wall biosynthesis